MEALLGRLDALTGGREQWDGWAWLRAAGLAAAVFSWWGLSLLQAGLVPSPAQVSRVLVAELASGELSTNVAVSVVRVLTGFVIGGATGLLVGGLLGWSWLARATLGPFLEIARPVPPLAWVPVAILWFGIEEGSKVFVVALGVFFPTLVNTYFGVRGLDRVYVWAARTLGAGPGNVFFRVVLRGALPDIFTGLKMGWGLGFISLVAAELIAARSGLGYMLMTARLNDRLDAVLATVIVIGALGLGSEWVLRMVHARTLAWHRGIERVTE